MKAELFKSSKHSTPIIKLHKYNNQPLLLLEWIAQQPKPVTVSASEGLKEENSMFVIVDVSENLVVECIGYINTNS